MSKEMFKVIGFWTGYLIVGIIGMLSTTFVVYTILDCTGLHGLGQMLLFQFGLAFLEISVFGLIGINLYETTLDDDDLEELDRLEIFRDPE